MKKTKLLLVLSVLVLTGCDFNSIFNTGKTDTNTVENQTAKNTENSENNAGNTGENAENTATNTSTNTNTNTGSNTGFNTGTNAGTNTGSNTGSNTGTTTDQEVHTNTKIDPEGYVPENTPYSLSNWTNFSWHTDREPEYEEDWAFFMGTSFEPNGCLYENPNEKLDYSGAHFKENTLIFSPALESWLKVEIRFTFWFSSHTSSNYQAAKNRPQFLLEAYDNKGSLLSTQEIEIERSDVPTNNTAKEMKFYIREENMYFFALKFNNYIPNGNSGYTAILCDAALKGWPYSN